MERSTDSGELPRLSFWVPILALENAVLHLYLVLAGIGRYGYFRDELYYVACGERLAWGYVDHPPLVALIARVTTELFGTSLVGLRLLPILTGSAVVLVAGLLARELGGGRFAQVLSALCVLIAPAYLFTFHILSMNVFDVLLWALGALVLARLLRTESPRLWLLFGLIAGLGLLNKWSFLFFGFGVFAGLALSPARRQLLTPWPWLGGALAGLIALPHVLWQIRNGWPTLEFIANATANKNIALSPLAFLTEQVLQVHPLTLPVWLGGLVFCLAVREARPFRLFGWAYLGALAVLLAQASKAYYLAPAYPMLFAAGAVAWERWTARRGLGWVRIALPVLLLVGGIVTAPLAVPIFAEEPYIRYAERLGIQPSSGERHRMGRLPQHFADMHGWPELVATVAKVYNGLPEAERRRCAIFGQNYGEAGAIDLLGDHYGLPDALSGHNHYFLWGPRGSTGECVIVLGDDAPTLSKLFEEVIPVAEHRCADCMPYEEMTIHLCRRLRVPMAELWPRIKHYD
jgi:Dolichyl-phosphate-mannose-protein mannosyltransferase